ncbi:unnamed protein product, partial [Thlaspi arvense]
VFELLPWRQLLDSSHWSISLFRASILAKENTFQGVLKGFDQATNIILDESHERVFSTKCGIVDSHYRYGNGAYSETELVLNFVFIKRRKGFTPVCFLFCTKSMSGHVDIELDHPSWKGYVFIMTQPWSFLA